MEWAQYSNTWPHSAASRFVRARPHLWHVQEMGTGPVVLLLHGAGGAVHSWRNILPGLAQDFTVFAPDLPGHGFTKMGAMQRSSLTYMAEDIQTLLQSEGIVPDLIIGHSAGGAIALELARILAVPPKGIVGINAALDNFKGVAGWLFPMMAKMLALNPLTAPTFAAMSSNRSVESLISGTGSHIDATGLGLYRAVIKEASHVKGALSMMAQWSLDELHQALSDMDIPTLLLTADNDKAVPPETAERVATKLPNAQVIHLRGLGHLAQEENPELVLEHIAAFTQEIGLLPAQDT